jgi:hypothetical protein
MDRYKTSKIKKDKSTHYDKLETKLYKKIPKSQNDIYLMTQYGDRFDKLANEYYKDPTLWWYLAKANSMKFNNIPEGKLIRIPANVSHSQ